jgi:folylpolyglutamate synthase/dihydrofolate synthase
MCLRMANQWKRDFAPASGYTPFPDADDDDDMGRQTIFEEDASHARTAKSIKSGIHLGLRNMSELMTFLPAITTPYVHIAGTNGKGSVSAMIDSCLRDAGLRTGRYNSPHLITIRDAILVNGKETDADTYESHRQSIETIIQDNSLEASEFEITTAVAFSIFAAKASELDVLIIECGMGGLRDATNVLDTKFQLCAILTTVDLDHQGFLGDTIEAITGDKLGITIPDGILLVGKQDHAEVYGMAQRKANELNVDVYETDRNPQPDGSASADPGLASAQAVRVVLDWVQNNPATSLSVSLPLAGEHQMDNLATALMAVQILAHHDRCLGILPRLQSIKGDNMRRGIKKTVWKGRCSWIRVFYPPASLGPVSPSLKQVDILVDGAHNSSAALQLRRYIDNLHVPSMTPITYIIGLSKSPPKTPASVLQPLLEGCRSVDRVIPVSFTTPIEGMPWISNVPMEDVRKAAIESGIWPENVIAMSGEPDSLTGATLLQALQTLPNRDPGIVVVTGSLYLVADAYRMMEEDS